MPMPDAVHNRNNGYHIYIYIYVVWGEGGRRAGGISASLQHATAYAATRLQLQLRTEKLVLIT